MDMTFSVLQYVIQYCLQLVVYNFRHLDNKLLRASLFQDTYVLSVLGFEI